MSAYAKLKNKKGWLHASQGGCHAVTPSPNPPWDQVYGESSLGKEKGCDESSVLEPTNPYSAAKAGAEMMCRAYLTSYGLPIIITRGNNV